MIVHNEVEWGDLHAWDVQPKQDDQSLPRSATFAVGNAWWWFAYRIRKMSIAEAEYQSRMKTLTGRERVARSMAMLKWTREMIARQIIAQEGPMSDERLKWKVALRLYASDAAVCRLVESKLAHVSD